MHNLAVRPGSIIGEDDPFTPGCYFLPLPPSSTIEYTITPPNGDDISITMEADASGYANDMGQRFELNQQGVWLVKSLLTQDTESGGVLGTGMNDKWEVYVINPGNDIPIEFHLPFQMPFDTSNELLVLSGDLTASDVVEGTVHISSTFNGAVIEQTSRELQDGFFVYSLDLAQINNSYPNFDPLDARDRIVMTFFVDGRNSSGERRMAARLVYYQGGNLFAGEKDFTPIDPQTWEERLRALTEAAETEEAHEIRGRTPESGEETE
jgi:hypothetical protein